MRPIKDYLKYAYLKTLKRDTIAGPGDFKAVRDGSDWNPLLKYPRNESCYCGSGVKFKKCCLPRTQYAVDKKAADAAKPLVDIIRKKHG